MVPLLVRGECDEGAPFRYSLQVLSPRTPHHSHPNAQQLSRHLPSKHSSIPNLSDYSAISMRCRWLPARGDTHAKRTWLDSTLFNRLCSGGSSRPCPATVVDLPMTSPTSPFKRTPTQSCLGAHGEVPATVGDRLGHRLPPCTPYSARPLHAAIPNDKN